MHVPIAGYVDIRVISVCWSPPSKKKLGTQLSINKTWPNQLSYKVVSKKTSSVILLTCNPGCFEKQNFDLRCWYFPPPNLRSWQSKPHTHTTHTAPKGDIDQQYPFKNPQGCHQHVFTWKECLWVLSVQSFDSQDCPFLLVQSWAFKVVIVLKWETKIPWDFWCLLVYYVSSSIPSIQCWLFFNPSTRSERLSNAYRLWGHQHSLSISWTCAEVGFSCDKNREWQVNQPPSNVPPPETRPY